ncbi:hypothetical protein A8709_13080 [Paenibacillus pectinilyticus]|uniref:Uncharacterized protein n=1 Tax=Paenibacillus pectinilyticus TaxID=512399 RepID=A0A1C1A3B7_9BACL|nr:hypothetical protein [Paenibacillus pectinilyticus]OCT15045.1 hypothetical protein A8709_13080 [Paenibacillus pectinilyticus]
MKDKQYVKFFGIIMLLTLLITTGCGNDKVLVFDKEKWIEAKANESWSLRQKMAQYLIGEQTLIGKDKMEIIELLGKPEEYSNVSKDEMYYTISLQLYSTKHSCIA